MQPLDNIRVLDFTTLLPGPFATLILAEAGAEVIKIERPGGEEMRAALPKFGPSSVLFSMLNRGKKSIEIDLKQDGAAASLTPLIESADVLIEQFRPGVMERLGLGWDAVHAINPKLVYCSITGYGQTGPKADIAGHDLNYCADTGFLSLTHDGTGKPMIPQTQIADIGAGTYPAVMNIMFALWRRERSGQGAYLDVAMTDNMFPFMWMPLALGHALGQWPEGNDLRLTGASARYQVYRTADDGHVSVGALEQKFWDNLCDCIELDDALRDDERDPQATIDGVAALFAARPTKDWESRLLGKDVCAVVIRSIDEAIADIHHQARGLFAHDIASDQQTLPALPVPVVARLRGDGKTGAGPALGSANALMFEPRGAAAPNAEES